jgi:hypothetical protein
MAGRLLGDPGMSFKSERTFILIAILGCTFGCKGAGVAAAVAVTALRVAAVSAAASHASEERPVEVVPLAGEPAPVVVVAAPVAPSRCMELTPGVDSPPAARAVQCGGRVLVQDGETGAWHEVHVE